MSCSWLRLPVEEGGQEASLPLEAGWSYVSGLEAKPKMTKAGLHPQGAVRDLEGQPRGRAVNLQALLEATVLFPLCYLALPMTNLDRRRTGIIIRGSR